MSEDGDYPLNEDNINYKSITCENIPEIFLDKLAAKNYFGKFGKIKRFILRPKRLSCTVEYESENDAEEALVNAGYFNGHNFLVKHTQNEVAHTKHTEEWVDSEIQAELDAMRPMGTAKPQRAPKLPKSILKTRIGASDTLLKAADSALRSELEAILKRPATDNEERFRILDARDKLMRLTNTRSTDIKHVESIKGFCPDMCPEKERLLRENRNQIAIFEADERNKSRMDHKLAVKEYSRSSADQETPLSHELRSESVLKLTMNYLMHKIMDLCDCDDVNIADWYHFVWDRTRSIRKDITQQELCSLTTVDLVEQCARFHVHCAARLVAEDSSVFDQKINTENLTKCLQTLKYMYHDLRLQNKTCPNEAEFRSYVILLNLNDSNFLWEVKQLPEQIQNSTHIRFALDTYLAMESNNYVGFFKLVRKATYMNACILLRYFTQVRIRAIRAIMVAYKWPMHVTSIAVRYFRNILGFESDEAACVFFEYHGLDCDGDRVNLDKKAFYIPEMPIPMERDFYLVEDKKTCTAGEAVCGRPLESLEAVEKHIPHDSFDERGFLKPESWNAEDQQKVNDIRRKISMDSDGLFKVPSASSPISPRFKSPSPGLKPIPETNKVNIFQPIVKPNKQAQSAPSTKNIFGSFATKDVAKSTESVFSIPALTKPSSQNDTQKPIAKSIFGGMSTTFKVNSAPASSLPIFSNCKPETSSKSADSFSSFSGSNEKNVFDMNDSVFRHFQPSTPSLDIFKRPNQVTTKFHIENTEVEIDKTNAEKEKQEQFKKRQEVERVVKEQKRKQEIEERRQRIVEIDEKSGALLSSFLEAEIKSIIAETASIELRKYVIVASNSEQIAGEIIAEIIAEILLEIVDEEIKIDATHRNLLVKYYSIWRANVKRAFEHRKLMESIPVWLSEQSVSEAHPQQAETLEMKQRYLLGVPGKFQIKSPKEKTIDVFKIFLKQFQTKNPSLSSSHLLKFRRYFKFVVSLPQENEELRGFNSFMNSWLEKRIQRRIPEEAEEFLCESHGNISICLRKIEGILPKNEKKQRVNEECDHADGVIFIVSAANLFNSRKRLHHLLKLSTICAKIPLAIVTYNVTFDEEHIENELQLQKLIEDNRVSYYSLFPSTVFINKNNLHEAFVEVFKFLAQYTKQNEQLEMQNLCPFLRTVLGDEFWKRLADSSRINPSFRKICSQPEKVTSLYNEAIDLLIKMLEENYEDHPEFPKELRKFVPKHDLDIPVGIEYFPLDWKDEKRNKSIRNFLKCVKVQPFPVLSANLKEIEQSLLEYSSQCISSATYAKRAGYGAIKYLLESINAPELQHIPHAERFDIISWLPIIQSISLELLTWSWHSNNPSLPNHIIYNKLAFKEYTSVPWWFENVTLKSIKMDKAGMDETETEFSESSVAPPSAKKSKLDIDTLLERSSALLEKADRNIAKYRTITTKSREISRPLDEQFYKQELFDRKLKRFIQTKL